MNFDRILDKPFLAAAYSWSTTDLVNTQVGVLNLPSGALSNSLVQVPFNSSCLYRMKACVILQVSGTPMHQGILLASVVPLFGPPLSITQMLQAPHAFLNANESTPICIEVPFYQRTGLAKTSFPSTELSNYQFDYASVRLSVVNPLSVGGSASTSLTISAHLVIKEAEFYVPKPFNVTWVPITFEAEGFVEKMFKIPTFIFDGLAKGAKIVTGDFIDTMRMGIRELTGFHNPNSPSIKERMITTTRNFTNNVDQPTVMEKLDQHSQFDRIIRDFKFSTKVDEMDVSNILKKPMYLTTFAVNVDNTYGTLLMAYPITPYVEIENSTFYSPMRILYENSRYWRGSLKLHIQSSMTNFHYCKLIVARNYVADVNMLTNFPRLDDLHNIITDTLEFSAGGQIHTVELPFCSVNEQLECTKNTVLNAYQHGMFYIYLLQPLVTNGSVPTSINFNAYMSAGDDFQYYGYSTDLFSVLDYPPTFISDDIVEPVASTPKTIPNREAEDFNIPFSVKNFIKKLNNESVKFEPESSTEECVNETTVGVSAQACVNNEHQPVDTTLLRFEDFKPMLSIRDYIRRVIPMYSNSYPVTDQINGGVAIKLSEVVRGLSQTQGALSLISRMYLGYSGGLKLKVVVKGDHGGKLYYVPPGMWNNIGTNAWLSTFPLTPLNASSYQDPGPQFGSMLQEIPATYPFSPNSDRYVTTLFEFVIPNMNPNKFIGGPASSTRTRVVTAESDIGFIVYLSNNEPASDFDINILTGYTDETRFGFQTITPQVRLLLDGSGNRISCYNPTATGGFSTSVTSFRGCYYSKAV